VPPIEHLDDGMPDLIKAGQLLTDNFNGTVRPGSREQLFVVV
jgi:hypothetical protein